MNADEKKIRRAFKEKNWNAIKTSDSWQIFKIMSEFVEGFEKLSKIIILLILQKFMLRMELLLSLY